MVTVGEYLCDRLKALGVDHVFGVPGDYVLGLMDVMVKSPLELVCTCNELNAGYSNRRFFQRLNTFLDDEFIVISDTGDAIVATIDLIMHKGADFIGQAFYLSIGYSLPACLGAAKAAPDCRPLVIIGDGAFQMTAQELSTIIRHRLNPIIFLINNDGYTIERAIHDGPYNDLQPWKYHELPSVFGECWSGEVWTEGDLEEALLQAKANNHCPSFIEIHLERFDCSQGLIRLGQAISQMDRLDS